MNQSVQLSQLLGPRGVLASQDASDKKSLLLSLAEHAGKVLSLEPHLLFDVLWEREKLGTTGVGRGIAIPHARVPGLETVQGFFAQFTAPVAFESVDGQPVDLVFLLLAPEDAGADHLHALARVSEALRNQDFCAALRVAKGVEAVRDLLHSAQSAS